MSWKRTLGAGLGAAALAVGPLVGAAAAAEASDATVTVVHGVPEATVDVYANDKKIISDFTFKKVSDALRVPGGTYKLEVRKAGDPASAEPIISATEEVPAGANVTVVAALSESGQPELQPYVNETGALASGSGRLTVRHTAAAPTVDVYAGEAKAISGLVNGEQQSLTVPAGTVAAKVTLAGATEAAIGPADVPVTAGMGTVVYAVGSAQDDNLGVVTQTYALGGMPATARAGEGPLAGGDGSQGWMLLGVGGLALAAAGGLSMARR
jgi:hypothetical protein